MSGDDDEVIVISETSGDTVDLCSDDCDKTPATPPAAHAGRCALQEPSTPTNGQLQQQHEQESPNITLEGQSDAAARAVALPGLDSVADATNPSGAAKPSTEVAGDKRPLQNELAGTSANADAAVRGPSTVGARVATAAASSSVAEQQAHRFVTAMFTAARSPGNATYIAECCAAHDAVCSDPAALNAAQRFLIELGWSGKTTAAAVVADTTAPFAMQGREELQLSDMLQGLSGVGAAAAEAATAPCPVAASMAAAVELVRVHVQKGAAAAAAQVGRGCRAAEQPQATTAAAAPGQTAGKPAALAARDHVRKAATSQQEVQTTSAAAATTTACTGRGSSKGSGHSQAAPGPAPAAAVAATAAKSPVLAVRTTAAARDAPSLGLQLNGPPLPGAGGACPAPRRQQQQVATRAVAETGKANVVSLKPGKLKIKISRNRTAAAAGTVQAGAAVPIDRSSRLPAAAAAAVEAAAAAAASSIETLADRLVQQQPRSQQQQQVMMLNSALQDRGQQPQQQKEKLNHTEQQGTQQQKQPLLFETSHQAQQQHQRQQALLQQANSEIQERQSHEQQGYMRHVPLQQPRRNKHQLLPGGLLEQLQLPGLRQVSMQQQQQLQQAECHSQLPHHPQQLERQQEQQPMLPCHMQECSQSAFEQHQQMRPQGRLEQQRQQHHHNGERRVATHSQQLQEVHLCKGHHHQQQQQEPEQRPLKRARTDGSAEEALQQQLQQQLAHSAPAVTNRVQQGDLSSGFLTWPSGAVPPELFPTNVCSQAVLRFVTEFVHKTRPPKGMKLTCLADNSSGSGSKSRKAASAAATSSGRGRGRGRGRSRSSPVKQPEQHQQYSVQAGSAAAAGGGAAGQSGSLSSGGGVPAAEKLFDLASGTVVTNKQGSEEQQQQQIGRYGFCWRSDVSSRQLVVLGDFSNCSLQQQQQQAALSTPLRQQQQQGRRKQRFRLLDDFYVPDASGNDGLLSTVIHPPGSLEYNAAMAAAVHAAERKLTTTTAAAAATAAHRDFTAAAAAAGAAHIDAAVASSLELHDHVKQQSSDDEFYDSSTDNNLYLLEKAPARRFYEVCVVDPDQPWALVKPYKLTTKRNVEKLQRQLPRLTRVEVITDACHPCLHNPLPKPLQLGNGIAGTDADGGDGLGQAAQRQPLMVVAAQDLPAGQLIGLYFGEVKTLEEDLAHATADLTGAYGVNHAYTMNVDWSLWHDGNCVGQHLVVIGDPARCRMALLNDAMSWGNKMGPCPRAATASCSCSRYATRSANTRFQHLLYRASDGMYHPVIAVYTSTHVSRGAELLANYSDGDEQFWDVITTNIEQYNYMAANEELLKALRPQLVDILRTIIIKDYSTEPSVMEQQLISSGVPTAAAKETAASAAAAAANGCAGASLSCRDRRSDVIQPSSDALLQQLTQQIRSAIDACDAHDAAQQRRRQQAAERVRL